MVGRENSLMKPVYYLIIFSFFDAIALVIQAVGGAGAAIAQQNGTSTEKSTNIMVNILIQLN
jgi:RTA1 like protein